VTTLSATFPPGHASADARFRARLFALLGMLLREAGDPAAAWSAMETAVGLGYLSANGYLGELAEAAGDTSAAILRYELASQDGTNWPLMNLARLYDRMNQPDETRAVVGRILARVEPDEIAETGDEMHERGDTSIALLFLRAGRGAGGGPAEAALARVIVDTEGPTKEAFELFHSALDRGDGGAAVSLGYLYHNQGDPLQAEAVWRRGIDLGNEYCMYNLGAMLMDHGRLDEAADLLDRAHQLGVEEAPDALEELQALRHS